MVIINPGNPTGQVFTKSNIEDVIKVCYEEGLCIIADEVYQQNIFDSEVGFHSFKKVKHQLGSPFFNLELVSLHSVSKGYFCECGFRGGYVEFDGVSKDVKEQLLKIKSTQMGTNAIGQIALDVAMKPPCEGDPSYKLFDLERRTILTNMSRKAKVLVENMKMIKGIEAQPVKGGLFLFPRITNMPEKAIAEAKINGLDPSLFWALQLLDKTGIAVTPGDSFKQKEDTYHFRLPVLVPMKDIEYISMGIKQFHNQFIKDYQ